MAAITSALMPVMLLIVLGYLLRRFGVVGDGVWAGMEKIAYYVFFPSLLVYNLARQSLDGVPWLQVLGVIVLTSVAAATVLVAWHLVHRSVSGATFTSIFQGGVRFNSYIALAVCEAFYGAEGLAAGAVAISFMIVTVNLLSVSAFAIWAGSGGGPKRLLHDIAANPLILACVTGLVLSGSGIGLPTLAADTLGLIGRAALPVGLMAVGAAVSLDAVRGHLLPVSVSSVVQYVMKPLTAAWLVGAFELDGVVAAAIIIIFITPIAPSSYILSRQLGGDTAAAASIITVQTLLAFVVMPVAMHLLL